MARVRPTQTDVVHQAADEASSTWAHWWDEFQAFQVHAVRDMLAVCNRCAAASSVARDGQAMAAAFQAAAEDWRACMEGVQHEWLQLVRYVPREAMTAVGWHLKKGAQDPAGASAHAGVPDLLEQSRLGFEMMLRPWLPATEFDHTDEVVA